MTVIDTQRTSRDHTTVELRSVCLTLGPDTDLSHLLRAAADVLEVAGVAVQSMEPSVDASGTWLRITCDVDPADVATLVSLPALRDHQVDPHLDRPASDPAERCPACELRGYLRG
ncbi:MAG: hypothetical protein ABWY80_02825 [Acidimicrobiia bacterium]